MQHKKMTLFKNLSSYVNKLNPKESILAKISTNNALSEIMVTNAQADMLLRGYS